MSALLDGKSREFYLSDRVCALAYEPSGEDFLSPCLAEADLMRRVVPQPEFAGWLGSFALYLTSGAGRQAAGSAQPR